MPVTTNTRKLAALLGASGAGIGTDGLMQPAGIDADMATQAELDAQLYSDVSVRQDISTLALRQAIGDNQVAYNLPNSFIDQFEDNSGIGTETNTDRHEGDEYVSTSVGLASMVGTLQYLGSAQDAVSGLDDGTTLTVNQTTGQITVPTTLVESANTTVDNFAVRLDLGQSRLLSSPLRFSSEANVSATGGSNARIGVVEFNASTGANSGYLFHHNGSSGTAPTITKDGSAWGTLGGTADQEIVSQVFNNYGGYYSADSSATKWIQYAWTGSITARYLYFGSTTTQGIPGTVRFQSGDPLADFTREQAVVFGSATGTLIGNANVPSAAQTKVSGVMIYKDGAGTATIGTDLEIYFTCNGGTNWTEAASYTAVTPLFSTGVKMVKLGETTCTSGSDVRYKAVWANQADGSKDTQLHGIGLNY